MKIYLAGKWADRVDIRTVMDSLEAKGHVITHDWTACESSDERTPEYLQRCAHNDIEGVRNSEMGMDATKMSGAQYLNTSNSNDAYRQNLSNQEAISSTGGAIGSIMGMLEKNKNPQPYDVNTGPTATNNFDTRRQPVKVRGSALGNDNFQ